MSILLYPCTTWTKKLEKKLNGNYTRMWHVVLNKSWKLHPTKQHLCSHLPSISLVKLYERRTSKEERKIKEKKRERYKSGEREKNVWFGLVYLFYGISTPYGVFNARIWSFCEYLIIKEEEKKEEKWGRNKIGEKDLVWSGSFVCLFVWVL